VVDSKFSSSWGGWCSNEPLGMYRVDLWNNIRKGWRKFSTHTKFDVGDGSKVRLWHDLWCGNMALKDTFPDLFGIACAKDTFVVTHLEL
jgi:hypothetical protein